MRGDIGVPTATWWKADRYELYRGTHIRPAPNARLQHYDVVQDYRDSWCGTGEAELAYASLQNVDLDDVEDVLRWCSEFGLLGVLHHRLVSVALWPTWKPKLFAGLEQLRPWQTVLWGARTWDDFPAESIHEDSPSRPNGPELDGIPLEESELPRGRTRLRHPGAVIQSFGTGEVRTVGIVEGYGQFFPHVEGIPQWVERESRSHWLPYCPPIDEALGTDGRGIPKDLERQRFPLPSEPDFRRLYAEPWYLFKRAARGLHVPEEDSGDPASILTDELRFNLERVSPSAEISQSDAARHAWRIPSLLSAMSVFILQDLVLGDVRLPSCRHCGQRFPATRPNTLYCTATCRRTAEKNRERERDRQRKQKMIDRLSEQIE